MKNCRDTIVLSLWAAASLLIPTIQAQALHEPAGNQVLFGAWVDTADDGTTPYDFNQKFGLNFSVFQISQDIPLPAYDYVTGAGGPAPEYLVEQTQTDAAVFLTVYPTTFNISDADYQQLGLQLRNYTDTFNRVAYLRFAPEMQGTWFPYGFQPVRFVEMWRTMYTTIKAIAPKAIIVWAPNEGLGYPYSQTQANATELAALDTSGDNQVSAADDPYSPYYPGDDMVDWIGMSVYYKGPNYQDSNEPQAVGFCSDLIQNIDANTGALGTVNFYNEYCTKANKACMFSESGAAYHVDDATTGTQLALQRAWWTDCLTNTTFYDTFPRVKLMMHFEYHKYETGSDGQPDLRDYRLANASTILAPFSADLHAVADRFSWAQTRTLRSDVASTGVPATVTGGGGGEPACTKYCGQVVFTTDRNPATGAPSLFGNTRESSATRLQASIAVGATSFAMLCAGVWLSGRSARHAATP